MPDGKMPAGGWDPAQRLRDMDSEGIDAPFPGAVKQTLELLSGVPEASRRRVLG